MTDKKKKAGGPIRYEAIIPVLILTAITFIYFSVFFDRHVKSLAEYIGTQINGAEVNIEEVDISFIKGSLTVTRLEVTNPEDNLRNTIEIGKMNFKLVWDALLRMKFVVDDASIEDIMLMSKRSRPGKVLPPSPAKPSKTEALQAELVSQVQSKYQGNVLENLITFLDGSSVDDQIKEIRGTLKSEARINEMIKDIDSRKNYWDQEIKKISDDTIVKNIEKKIQSLKNEKNDLKKISMVKEIAEDIKKVDQKVKDVKDKSDQLQNEVKQFANFPKEVEKLVKEDTESLKNRFSIPDLDFKDLALNLFAKDFVKYLANFRKYSEVAKQYLPEKKEVSEEEKVVPPKRSEGKTYHFPVTTGYPLVWLKHASISSKGTEGSYVGDVQGKLTDVTTDPKLINKAAILDVTGNFPTINLLGVKALYALHHHIEDPFQEIFMQVNEFKLFEKLFVNEKDKKFGISEAKGTSTIKARIQNNTVDMSLLSHFSEPRYLVDLNTKSGTQILTRILNNIPLISLEAHARGPFNKLNIDLKSNLGDELGKGLKSELTAQIASAENKINALIDEKIKGPQKELLSKVNLSSNQLKSLNNIEALYKKHEKQLQAELKKLQGGQGEKLKEQGKKLLKGLGL
ncbi:MAG TPA: TIGR03545 family protein [Bacteriovoracaceae bacterium]|nr:TIGR03545 family protein [Bacteriovoracaceae bacterium]